MRARPSTHVYDRITIGLHWLTTILVIILWLIGEFVEDLLDKGSLRSGVWSLHFILGFVLAGLIVALPLWRLTRGRQLTVEDRGPLHHLAKVTHTAIYLLLFVVVGLGIANAFVRGVSLFGIVSLPQIGDRELRRPLTHRHDLAGNILMIVALFHAGAALVHHYRWRDAVLRRMLPATDAGVERP
jgi:cytochrome b561